MKKIFIILILITSITFGRQLTYKQVLNNFTKKINRISTLKITFNGEIIQKDTTLPKASDFRGEIIFKKPNKYRLKYNNLLTICDGKNVYKINFSSAQVILTKYDSKKDYLNPIALIKTLNKNYKKKSFKRTKKSYKISLKGKDANNYINLLNLELDKKTYMPTKITIVDNLNNQTNYEIKSITKNLKLSNKIFQYENNDTLELFDMRKK